MTRADLLQAGQKAFERCGYEAATTRMIARQAGCSEALIHRYFHSKSGLFEAVLRFSIAHGREISPPPGHGRRFVADILSAEIAFVHSQQALLATAIARAVHDPGLSRLLAEVYLGERQRCVLAELRRRSATRVRFDATYFKEVARAIVLTAVSLELVAHNTFGINEKGIMAAVRSAAHLLPKGVKLARLHGKELRVRRKK